MKSTLLLVLTIIALLLKNATATPPTCGDGIRQSNEQCDEGSANGSPGSGCSFSCTINPGCYCNAPAGQVSTCTCNNNSDYLYLLLGLLGLCCCLLLAAAAAAALLGGGNGGYGGYGGYGNGYGGYGGWRGLSARLFGKAAPAPVVENTSAPAFLPAVVVPSDGNEMPIRVLEPATIDH